MKNAAIGFRVHSGWTAMVALTVNKRVPTVLARDRPHLIETFTYEFRQPYHTAEKLPPAKAAAFVSQMQSESRRLALGAISKVAADLRKQGYELDRCALLIASGRPLPTLDKILASHSLIHTADGELFRGALLHASGRCRLRIATIKEKELVDSASRALHLKSTDLLQRVTDLGRSLGPPWSQDEKFATLAAWLALVSEH